MKMLTKTVMKMKRKFRMRIRIMKYRMKTISQMNLTQTNKSKAVI